MLQVKVLICSSADYSSTGISPNPNRLEQRMGRIHRYGQKEDVLVFNLVADNTREGQVLAKLLNKLDIIRESMGDDRVYDVIQDVLKDVSPGSNHCLCV